tara:strand:+ start:69 stop:542 length:474 start_codon:yes stop_codon:yes gene_type:complete
VEFDEVMVRYRKVATVGRSKPAPSGVDVDRAEQELGIKLPPSFVRFLRESKGKRPPFWDVLPILTGDRTDRTFDIVRANDLEHGDRANPIPAHYCTFHGTGTGDQVCFDTSSRRPDGEYQVVLWVHDDPPLGNLNDPLTWSSFLAWLDKEVDELETE